MEIEYQVLNEASSALTVPKPLYKDNFRNYIIMSYIPGRNLCDVINDDGTALNIKKKYVDMLGGWLYTFHKFFNNKNRFRIRGDAILRNFIINDKIYGLDFEESHIGKPVEDLAEICSSFLTTDPMFTDEKFYLASLFIESYIKRAEWKIEDDINQEISHALLKKIKRRPKDKEIISKYVKQIQSKGLSNF
ncbi:MAG: hypothetical protein QXS02_02200 [Candidatus Thermoplasmatota archaeon]